MSATAPTGPRIGATLLRRSIQLVLVAFAVVGLTTAVTTLWWRVTPDRPLDVLVYDQSVLTDDVAEHRSLEQILRYHHVPYDRGDYTGLEPSGRNVRGVWPSSAPDLVIMADLAREGVVANGVDSALTIDQVRDLESWIEAGVPTYGEFALVTEPTAVEVGEELQTLFGFRSTGWRVRYFDDLDNVSPGIRSISESPWGHAGPGLVAVSGPAGGDDPGRHLVVIGDDHLTGPSIEISGGPPGSPGRRVPFDGWVTLVEPSSTVAVDAVFHLPVDDDAQRELAAAGVPEVLPALIRGPNTIYLAGEAVRDETPFRLYRLAGGASFTRWVTGSEFQFFYQVLEPSIGWLLDQAED